MEFIYLFGVYSQKLAGRKETLFNIRKAARLYSRQDNVMDGSLDLALEELWSTTEGI